MASHLSCLLSRSSDRHSQHFCDVCKYMFRMDQSNGHNNQCSNCVFKVYAFCHHCSTVHEVPHRLASTMICLSNSSLSNTSHRSPAHHHPTTIKNESTFYHGDNDMHDNNNSSNSKIVDNDSNCLHDSSDSNESSSFLRDSSSTHGDSKVFFNGLNGHKFYYNSSQDKIGFIPHNTDDIPVPPQFQIPSSCQLNMSPHELELMLFINKNFLSPSIFDKVMKWAHSATAEGYMFNSPSYSTLKIQMNSTFIHQYYSINGGALKSKVVFLPEEVESDLPVTMWYYFEQSFGVVCKVPLRSSSHEGLCLFCFPQRKYTDCGSCVYNKITSADWIYEAFNNSLATESGMLWIRPGCLFVGIGHFDDSSNTDCLMKNSEHPFLQTILNLTLERRQSSDSWMLVSLLPDLEVSDLKK
jgi:hypothetical protein